MYPYEVEINVAGAQGDGKLGVGETKDPHHAGVMWRLSLGRNSVTWRTNIMLTCSDRLGYSFKIGWSIFQDGQEEPTWNGGKEVKPLGAETPEDGSIVSDVDGIDLTFPLKAQITVHSSTLTPACGRKPGSFSLLNLFENGCFQLDAFTDCRIVSQTVTFHAHKNILAAKGSVLKAMLKEDSFAGELVIDDAPPTVVQAFLVGLYDPTFLESCRGEQG